MKIRLLTLAVMAVIGLNMAGTAQEKTSFKASGKPTFKIFSNYHSTITDGKTYNQFELTRAYLGYQHQFSENWSGKLIFDVGNPKDGGGLEMTAYVKNALLSYKKDAWTVNFGMISTTSFKTQEKFWGYRYLLKSFQDEYKFGASADLGISAAYKFNDKLSADLILINGEGYKKLEQDSIFTIGAGITLRPLEQLALRGYFETTTKDEGAIKRQNSLALFAGYQLKKLSIGAEFNKQFNHGMEEGLDMTGYSFYSTLKLKASKLFARFDMLESENDWNAAKDGNLFVLGAEFNPVKGIKISPNYRNFSPSATGSAKVDYIYVNCEIKF
ncbi:MULTISPECIES: hypothetical protein [unclassified Carboxylicivirga]|uniref:hypothetical protein n=1 Tax=Carboxylicivirga TaxID=1628153 RepID=UPI003D34FA49